MARAALRQIAMGLLYKYGGLESGEIGHMMGLDYSTASQGRKRLRESLKSEEVARTYGEDRGKVVKSKDLTPKILLAHILPSLKGLSRAGKYTANLVRLRIVPKTFGTRGRNLKAKYQANLPRA